MSEKKKPVIKPKEIEESGLRLPPARWNNVCLQRLSHLSTNKQTYMFWTVLKAWRQEIGSKCESLGNLSRKAEPSPDMVRNIRKGFNILPSPFSVILIYPLNRNFRWVSSWANESLCLEGEHLVGGNLFQLRGQHFKICFWDLLITV